MGLGGREKAKPLFLPTPQMHPWMTYIWLVFKYISVSFHFYHFFHYVFHIIVNTASREVVAPRALDAWHEKIPESDVRKLMMLNVSPSLEIWWRESAANGLPSLYHVTVGVGIPELTHLKSTVVPALFEELLGCLAMFGGTEIRDYCRSYRQMKKKSLVINCQKWKRSRVSHF